MCGSLVDSRVAAPENAPVLTRRRVLGLGLLSGLALLAAGSTPFWSARERDILRAVIDRLFDPGEYQAPTPAQVDAVQAAETYLGHLPRRERLLCRGLIRTLEWGCLWTRGSRFTRLTAQDQDDVLADLETSRLYPRRLAFSSLKQIGAMAYYQHPSTWAHLAYPGPWVKR